MPLRAKIDPSSPLSTDASLVKEPPFVADDVLFSDKNALRKIILNRPKKLNSLDLSMIQKIQPRLEHYAKRNDAKLILIAGNGRAFCAGGDVATLAASNKEGKHHIGKEYFAAEYILDHMIATYTKPVVALVDGICMGGGVGLSINAPIRIMTEKTVFAMPEATIGFFPDVGASRFLAKLGNVGKYLACTSARLLGAQAVLAGLGTHFVSSAKTAELERRLGELDTSDITDIRRTIDEFTDPIQETYALGEHEKELSSFGKSTVAEILHQLDVYAAQGSKFAAETVKTMREKSPISLAVAIRAQEEGKNWAIDEVFEREYNIACEFMHNTDFVEGVESTLKHKRLGQWKEKDFNVNVDKFFAGRAKLFK